MCLIFQEYPYFYQFYYRNDREQKRFIEKCEALLFLVANVMNHNNNTDYQMALLSWTLRLSVMTGTYVHCIFIVDIYATAKIASKI